MPDAKGSILPTVGAVFNRARVRLRVREIARLQSAPTGATVVAVCNRARVRLRAFKARLRERWIGIDKGRFSQDLRKRGSNLLPVGAVFNRACVRLRAYKARLRERRSGIWDNVDTPVDFRET